MSLLCQVVWNGVCLSSCARSTSKCIAWISLAISLLYRPASQTWLVENKWESSAVKLPGTEGGNTLLSLGLHVFNWLAARSRCLPFAVGATRRVISARAVRFVWSAEIIRFYFSRSWRSHASRNALGGIQTEPEPFQKWRHFSFIFQQMLLNPTMPGGHAKYHTGLI